jgi:hypothetical protein
MAMKDAAAIAHNQRFFSARVPMRQRGMQHDAPSQQA